MERERARACSSSEPDDAVFLAPGWHYRLRCVGDEPAFFVYGMTPTPE